MCHSVNEKQQICSRRPMMRRSLLETKSRQPDETPQASEQGAIAANAGREGAQRQSMKMLEQIVTTVLINRQPAIETASRRETFLHIGVLHRGEHRFIELRHVGKIPAFIRVLHGLAVQLAGLLNIAGAQAG